MVPKRYYWHNMPPYVGRWRGQTNPAAARIQDNLSGLAGLIESKLVSDGSTAKTAIVAGSFYYGYKKFDWKYGVGFGIAAMLEPVLTVLGLAGYTAYKSGMISVKKKA